MALVPTPVNNVSSTSNSPCFGSIHGTFISRYGTANGAGVNYSAWRPFDQADTMLVSAAKMQAIIDRVSPTTKVNVNEIGSLYGCPGGNEIFGAERWYFNAIAAVYAYVSTPGIVDVIQIGRFAPCYWVHFMRYLLPRYTHIVLKITLYA